jgi:hypothetical protein
MIEHEIVYKTDNVRHLFSDQTSASGDKSGHRGRICDDRIGIFLFIFSIFVVSIDMFWQMTLDDAVRNATRQVQIGNITSGPAFVSAVCQEFGLAAPNCAGTLQYSVQGGPYVGTGGIAATGFSLSGTLQAPQTFSGVTATTAGAPILLLVQVAYPLPLKILAVPGGVATENGTPSLYSAVATGMEP